MHFGLPWLKVVELHPAVCLRSRIPQEGKNAAFPTLIQAKQVWAKMEKLVFLLKSLDSLERVQLFQLFEFILTVWKWT